MQRPPGVRIENQRVGRCTGQTKDRQEPASPDLREDTLSGGLDALEQCLIHRLPAGQHAPVLAAVKTLRRERQTRNAIAHCIVQGGGLVSRLRELVIYDVPPNWAEAWDNIRVQTTDALTVLRNELRQWVDDTD
jgi:hypothetical protein